MTIITELFEYAEVYRLNDETPIIEPITLAFDSDKPYELEVQRVLQVNRQMSRALLQQALGEKRGVEVGFNVRYIHCGYVCHKMLVRYRRSEFDIMVGLGFDQLAEFMTRINALEPADDALLHYQDTFNYVDDILSA